MSKKTPSLLRHARQGLGLTCEEVGHKLDITKGWVSNVERNGTNSLKTAEKLKGLFPHLTIEQICNAEKVKHDAV